MRRGKRKIDQIHVDRLEKSTPDTQHDIKGTNIEGAPASKKRKKPPSGENAEQLIDAGFAGQALRGKSKNKTRERPLPRVSLSESLRLESLGDALEQKSIKITMPNIKGKVFPLYVNCYTS